MYAFDVFFASRKLQQCDLAVSDHKKMPYAHTLPLQCLVTCRPVNAIELIGCLPR